MRIEPYDLLFHQISLLTALINPFTQARATAMVAAGQIRLDPLISPVIPLEEAAKAIANPPLPGEAKVIIAP